MTVLLLTGSKFGLVSLSTVFDAFGDEPFLKIIKTHTYDSAVT